MTLRVNEETSKFGPWFCPYCGLLNSRVNCDSCFSARPFEMPPHNPATSILSIWHGPIGYYGLPQYLAVLLLFIDASNFLSYAIADLPYSENSQKHAPIRLHK